MKKVFLLIFSLFFHCIQLPNPSLEKSTSFFYLIYSNQEGCRFLSKNSSIENEYCSAIKFGDCSSVKQEQINKNRRSKILAGLRSLALSIDQCTIDAYNEIQYINSLSESTDPFFAKKNEIPVVDSFIPLLSCEGFKNSNKMANSEFLFLDDANIYLAIFAQNSNCSLLIPLNEYERSFVSSYKKGEKLIYTARL